MSKELQKDEKVLTVQELVKKKAIEFELWKIKKGYYTPLKGKQMGEYFVADTGEWIAKNAAELYELWEQGEKK